MATLGFGAPQPVKKQIGSRAYGLQQQRTTSSMGGGMRAGGDQDEYNQARQAQQGLGGGGGFNNAGGGGFNNAAGSGGMGQGMNAYANQMRNMVQGLGQGGMSGGGGYGTAANDYVRQLHQQQLANYAPGGSQGGYGQDRYVQQLRDMQGGFGNDNRMLPPGTTNYGGGMGNAMNAYADQMRNFQGSYGNDIRMLPSGTTNYGANMKQPPPGFGPLPSDTPHSPPGFQGGTAPVSPLRPPPPYSSGGNIYGGNIPYQLPPFTGNTGYMGGPQRGNDTGGYNPPGTPLPTGSPVQYGGRPFWQESPGFQAPPTLQSTPQTYAPYGRPGGYVPPSQNPQSLARINRGRQRM